LAFALVYVPEGIKGETQDINFATKGEGITSIYVPEQHVMASGAVTFGSVQRYFVPSGRSLASNDTIWLYIRAPNNDTHGAVTFRCSFLVAFA
jgi:hypothetical protein